MENMRAVVICSVHDPSGPDCQLTAKYWLNKATVDIKNYRNLGYLLQKKMASFRLVNNIRPDNDTIQVIHRQQGIISLLFRCRIIKFLMIRPVYSGCGNLNYPYAGLGKTVLTGCFIESTNRFKQGQWCPEIDVFN